MDTISGVKDTPNVSDDLRCDYFTTDQAEDVISSIFFMMFLLLLFIYLFIWGGGVVLYHCLYWY